MKTIRADEACTNTWCINAHGSEFALDDGRVLNGPATHNQPCLVVRERDGRIEVKVAPRTGDHAAA